MAPGYQRPAQLDNRPGAMTGAGQRRATITGRRPAGREYRGAGQLAPPNRPPAGEGERHHPRWVKRHGAPGARVRIYEHDDPHGKWANCKASYFIADGRTP